MKPSELSSFYFFGTVSPRSGRIVCCTPDLYVAPIVDDKIARPRLEAPSTDYNNMSVNDMKVLHQFKDCDSLHRPDIIAAQYRSAENRRTLAEKFGFDSLIQNKKYNK